MSIPLTVNGSTFQYPQTGNLQWGAAATAWASAVTTGMLQKAGGTFTLTQEVDFGADFGLKSIVFKSRSSNISQSGFVRGSNTDLITWRNGANNGDNTLGVNSSNVLLYNGSPIGSSISVANSPTIDLDFTSNILTATFVSLGAAEDGYVFAWDFGTSSWIPTPQGGGVDDLEGDVTGPTDNTVVEEITGRPDGYVLVKCNDIIFDGYAINPTITQNNLGGGGGGGGGEGLTIENGRLKIVDGPDVVLHLLEFFYTIDEYNYGAAELCQLVIDLGFNGFSPLVVPAYSTLPYVTALTQAALDAGLIIAWNGDAMPDGRAWLCQSDILTYMNSMPNVFVRAEIEVNLPPIYGDYPPLSAYVDGCLGLVNAYRAAGGTKVIQVGSYQGGRRLEYPRDAGTTVCAGDPLGKTLLGWQAYWANNGTWYQGNADLPNGIDGTLEGTEQYNALNGTAATCMGILWVNTEGVATDVVDIIELCLDLDQSFMWWDLWKDTEGADPHLNRLVTPIWDPPVTWTPTADIIVPLILPSQVLYFEDWVGGGGGGGGGGGPTGLSTGNTMTVKAQDGYTTGGTITVKSGVGGSINGDVQLYTGHDLAAAFTPDTVIMNIGGSPLFWATNDIIKHYYGQAFNTRLVVNDITAQPDDTLMGIQDLTDNITITLPTADLQVGLIYFIRDMDGSLEDFTVTIDAGGNSINGETELVMNTADSSIIIALIDNGQWFTVGGGAGGGGGVPSVSEPDHIFITAGDAVGFKKSLHKDYIYEEFTNCLFTEIPASGSSGGKTLVHFANTNWLGGANITDGQVAPKTAEQSHPGVITLASGSSGIGTQATWINLGDFNEGGYFHPYYVGDVYELECVMKANDTTNIEFMFGLSDEPLPSLASNTVAFHKSTLVGSTVHARCEFNDGYTDQNSAYDPEDKWTKYRILQSGPSEFEFYINNNLTNTITTNIPTTKVLSPFFTVHTTNGGGESKSLDIDYFYLGTKDLGERFEGPSGAIEFIRTATGTTFPLNFEISSGDNRLLVVSCTRSFGDGASSTATFDGVAMDVATNSNGYVQIFYMFDPPIGFYNFTSSVTSGRIVMCQYNGVGSFQEASQGSVQSFNYTVGGAALLVCQVGGDPTPVPLSGCTSRFTSGGIIYVDNIQPTAGTFTVGTSGGTFVDAAGAAFLGA